MEQLVKATFERSNNKWLLGKKAFGEMLELVVFNSTVYFDNNFE